MTARPPRPKRPINATIIKLCVDYTLSVIYSHALHIHFRKKISTHDCAFPAIFSDYVLYCKHKSSVWIYYFTEAQLKLNLSKEL